MATTSKPFGDWLKAERERKNLTPTALANAAGVTPQYINNLEKNVPTRNGKPPKPSTDKCIRFANALGVHYLEALRAAGHVPGDIPESEVKARMAGDYVVSLTEEKQEEALSYLKFLFEKFGDKSKMRELAPRNPAVVRKGEKAPEPLAKTAPRVGSKKHSSRQLEGERTHSKTAAKNGSNKRR